MKRYKQRKLKRFLITISVILLVFIIFIWLYNIYSRINITEYISQNSPEITRTSQTVDQISQNSEEISDVIEEVSECVVGISKIKENGSSIFLKDGLEKLGLGTGIVVSEDGYILTNEHVSGARYSNCYVTLENGKVYNATVEWSDSDLDLSIIKINMKGLKYATLGDSNNIKVGHTVYAIGNPIGFEFQRTVTAGIISALNRTIKLEEENKISYMSDLIQTDATINPGNSGGPLITPRGQVIGINSIKVTSAEGIGFAIPINIVKPIIQKFITTGHFEEASIGVFAYDKMVIPYLDSNVKFDTGIYIAQINIDSPAYKMGLKEKDIITKIDGIELEKMSDLRTYIYSKNPNEEVVLTILRNNTTMEIKITLSKKL